jgi:hypothetical protein
VHPGDEPDAGVIRVGFAAQRPDIDGVRQHRLKNYFDRNDAIGIQADSDLLRMLRDLREGLRPVEVLTSGDKPQN